MFKHVHKWLGACLFLAGGNLFAADPSVFIRASQVGYATNDVKVAVAFSETALPVTFKVLDAASGKVVLEAKPQGIAGVKWAKFEQHADLDFSALTQPGRYVLQVGEAKSLPFTIGPVYAELPDQLLEFMRQQRCGYNPWFDTVCHSFDGRTAFGPLPAGTFLDCSGGWHDAGDQLKYLITSANATAQLLLAYQIVAGGDDVTSSERRQNLSPEKIAAANALFTDKCNALGQPGTNGIPDILDEAKWGLDWMRKLHPAPDQLYHQIADDRDHKGWRLPQDENVDYGWGEGKYRVVYAADGKPQGLKQYQSEATGVANLAGRYAAAMGLAFQVWKDNPRMKAYAVDCLRAGIEVYAMGKAKEGYQQGNSYGAPYRYEETTWADDMEWGAAELYRATGKRDYLKDAERYAELAANDTWMPHDQTKHYQYYPFQNAGHFRLYPLVDKPLQAKLAGYYRAGLEACVARGAKNPYRVGVPFIWCSNNLLAALATQGWMYEKMTGDKTFREFSARQRDWLLGRNPWGTVMFTEIGTVSPKDVHLPITKLLKKSVRGGLVDGPVYERIFKSLKGVSAGDADPFAPFQDELAVYHDSIFDYSTNEPTMDGTASAILLWALYAVQ